jgi:hypothetical protein
MSDFSHPSEQLTSHWVALQTQWSDTRDSWADAVATRFEREFWAEWTAAVPEGIKVLRDLEMAMEQADRNTWSD